MSEENVSGKDDKELEQTGKAVPQVTAQESEPAGDGATVEPKTGEGEAKPPTDWKYLSRKHEKQAKENYRNWQDEKAKAEQTGERLQDALIENARLKAQKAHPELTDKDFDEFCKETDPDAIMSWADAMAERFGSVGVQKKQEPNPNAYVNRLMRLDNSAGKPTIAVGSYQDAYRQAMERNEERFKQRSQHVK